MQITNLRRLISAPPALTAAQGEDASMLEYRQRLQDQLVAQCAAMAQHAMATGLAVPPELIGQLDAYFAGENQDVATALPMPPTADEVGGAPAAAALRIQDLAAVHQQLTAIVAPATPAAIQLFAREQKAHPSLSAVGPVPLVRHFLLLSAFSLLTMLLVSLSDMVNTDTMSKSLLTLSGWPLLLVELFLLSAASLGSCFAILQKLNNYVAAGNYDPKYQATYWGRWVMGVISGILLSQILYSMFVHLPSAAGQQGAESLLTLELGQPILALLGGYSASLVHRLLNRVMTAIETLFGGRA
jgi:hypothetical protein